jgi:hypothetical protein
LGICDLSAAYAARSPLALAFAWYGLIVLVFVPQPSLPLWIPMVGGVAWAALAFFAIKRWVTSAGCGDLHRWGLVSSAILACMVAGFMGSNTWSRIDLIAKVVLNVTAVVLLLLLKKKRHNVAAKTNLFSYGLSSPLLFPAPIVSARPGSGR